MSDDNDDTSQTARVNRHSKYREHQVQARMREMAAVQKLHELHKRLTTIASSWQTYDNELNRLGETDANAGKIIQISGGLLAMIEALRDVTQSVLDLETD